MSLEANPRQSSSPLNEKKHIVKARYASQKQLEIEMYKKFKGFPFSEWKGWANRRLLEEVYGHTA